MKHALKNIAKKIFPEKILNEIVLYLSKGKIQKAKEIFDVAPIEPEWLGWDDLEALQKEYPFRVTPSYDYESRLISAEKIARKLDELINFKSRKIDSVLELGCQEGFVCFALSKMGLKTTGIDLDHKQFSDKVMQAGVNLQFMDASKLDFPDSSFDFVFSHASFEHFDDPETSLKEAMRVVRKGGYIYLYFGPLYMSPLGLHAYASITVPYCHMLFPIDMIKKFAREKNLRHKEFIYVNEWSYEAYSELFKKYSKRLQKIIYSEKRTTLGIELIMKYPSCFKSKTSSFDDLMVDSIEVLFRRIN